MYFIIKFHLPLRVFVPFYILSFHVSVFRSEFEITDSWIFHCLFPTLLRLLNPHKNVCSTYLTLSVNLL